MKGLEYVYFVWFPALVDFFNYLVREFCAVFSHSVVSDSVTPWTVARQAPLSMGILQAKILEWVAMPFSREDHSKYRDFSCIYLKGIWWESNEKIQGAIQGHRKPSLDHINSEAPKWTQ